MIKEKRMMIAIVFCAMLMVPLHLMALTVSFYIGDVSAVRDNKNITITMGTEVNSGDIIKTGTKSTVELVYQDGSKITIQEKSTVRVGSHNVKDSESVSLISGNISGKFEKLKKGSHKIYTPTIICAVRGTEFTVSVSDGGDSRIDLAEGKLALDNPYGSMELNPDERADTIVSQKPEKAADESTVEDWQTEKNKELVENPEEKSGQYETHVSTFKTRNKNNGDSINTYKTMVKKAGDKASLEKAGENIDTAQEAIQDDLLLNEASSASLENIMKDFEARNDSIYKKFKKLKEESNKVLEQQKKNYEAIQAVKEAHRKAYEKIMGKFQNDRNQILNDLNMDEMKPKIENK